MKQIHTPSNLTHKLAGAIEKAILNGEKGHNHAGASMHFPANDTSPDYKEIEVAALSLLKAEGKEFNENEKSFFVMLTWYCICQREKSLPIQEEHEAA